ncbi:MAG: glycoside hydrolase family 2 protein, partial [Clostridia bacterium]|nr:glycoside hydrolase family 2 protein [Clostridia bacterium]
MREILSFNNEWLFTKNAEIPTALPEDAEKVSLPHSWNATDGQDGGNDYYRGTCNYVKSFNKSDLPVAECYYVEVCGANSSADLYLNGNKLAHHDGGYSTWRVNITEALADENLLVISVDNAANETVYPQTADFTFYGGLYRNVNLIAVSASHFDLDYYGAPGIKVTPEISDGNATVEVEVYTTNVKEGQTLTYKIFDREGNTVAEKTVPATETKVTLDIESVHLWHGRRDPYLYTATATLSDGDEIKDSVKSRFGCRTFQIDAERGFILNGEEYALRGVSRHQDRLGIGNALLPEHHEEDIEFIMELGATTIRLAHYQHDQYFYDLCDEKGLVIWAEIPYISRHMPGARENTISQMKELVYQNYNHPCIVVWGLSNEITVGGAKDPDLLENHRILNDL